MRLVTIGIMFFMLTSMWLGMQMYEANPELDIYEITNRINWNVTFPEYNESFHSSVSEEYSNSYVEIGMGFDRMFNIIFRLTEFIGYFAYEITKFGIEFGFKNPNIDFDSILILAKYYLIILACGVLVSLIIPFVVVIYLIYELVKIIVQKLRRN